MSVSIKQIIQLKKDSRFTIAREYCGHSIKLYVIRFCGEFINAHINKYECYESAINSKYFIDWN